MAYRKEEEGLSQNPRNIRRRERYHRLKRKGYCPRCAKPPKTKRITILCRECLDKLCFYKKGR